MCPAHCERCVSQRGFIEHLLVTVLVTRGPGQKSETGKGAWLGRVTQTQPRRVRDMEGGDGESRRSEGTSRWAALSSPSLPLILPRRPQSGPAQEAHAAWPGSPISYGLMRTLPSSPPLPSLPPAPAPRSSTGKLGKSNFNNKEGLSKEGESLPELRDLLPHPVESRRPGWSCGLREAATSRPSEGPHTEQPL